VTAIEECPSSLDIWLTGTPARSSSTAYVPQAVRVDAFLYPGLAAEAVQGVPDVLIGHGAALERAEQRASRGMTDGPDTSNHRDTSLRLIRMRPP